ncbi:MAG: hypothetical protein ACR2RD_16235 [Woeseiaceae bacterium]
MGNVIAIASILLALIAAGCIAYIAWELTSGETGSDGPDNNDAKGPSNED